jgi:flagellar M-ring protein FliF
MAETTANEIQNELTTTSSNTGIMTRTGGAISELRRMAKQPAIQRALPAAAAILVIFIGLVAYLVLQQPSRTTLYASLPESEKSEK